MLYSIGENCVYSFHSLCHFAKDKANRLLLAEKSMTVLSATPEVPLLDDFELAFSNHTLELFFIALGDAIGPHRATHGSYHDSSNFKGSVNVIERQVRHVSGHPDSRGSDNVILVFQYGWELVNSLSKE